jgi:4-amino-4-deoxy-L-arabinose transferase-like glycosyltransferase
MTLTLKDSKHAVSFIRTSRIAAVRIDLLNLALIILGFAAVLLLLSPARSYPITDDWIYFQSVGDLLRLDYAPHEWTQPIALGHLSWGAVFTALFGHTFTVLTISNLVMSLACLLIFYVLLRHLDVTPDFALLGTAVLGFNPLYLFLTYSFMTDITFLVYMLGGCLCYIRGVQGRGEGWLWLGGLATALAYLTRQYGLLVMVAALAYLLLSSRWSWRRALAVVGIPIIAAIAYAVWERFQPSPLIAIQMNQVREITFTRLDLFLSDRAFRITWMLPSLGLSLLPLTLLPRHPLISLPILAFLAYYQYESARLFDSLWPRNGNLLDFTGYIFYAYNAAPVWNQLAWSVLGILGALVFSLQFAFYSERLWTWLRARPWRDRVSAQSQDPALILYLLGMMLVGVVFVLTPFLFDRYWLALLPALCVPALRHLSIRRASIYPEPEVNEVGVESRVEPLRPAIIRRMIWPRWALLAPLTLFSIVAMRDYKEHATARWQAGQSLVAQGIAVDHIDAGYEWDGFYNFKAGAQLIRDTHDLSHINYPPDAVIDPVYMVGDLPEPGYSEIGSLPYRSWLDGGQERRVLLLKRK